jgi:hypothetical protein
MTPCGFRGEWMVEWVMGSLGWTSKSVRPRRTSNSIILECVDTGSVLTSTEDGSVEMIGMRSERRDGNLGCASYSG